MDRIPTTLLCGQLPVDRCVAWHIGWRLGSRSRRLLGIPKLPDGQERRTGLIAQAAHQFERENLVLDEIMDGQENVFTIGAQHVAKRIAFSIHGEDRPCDLGIAQHRQSRLGQQDRIIGIGEEQGLELDGLRNEKVDRKSTRLNSSHVKISYAVFCLKKKNRYSL